MAEQIQEEKKQSKMKEQQYNKIIATLNQTVEEKNSKSVTQKEICYNRFVVVSLRTFSAVKF